MNKKHSMDSDVFIGKSKNVKRSGSSGQLIIEFTNRITDKDGQVKSEVKNKGQLACQISKYLFELLSAHSIPNHYISNPSSNSLLVTEAFRFPVEVVIRLIATGSLLRRLPFQKGERLSFPLTEYYYKKDEWNDPLISDKHLIISNICTADEIKKINFLTIEATRVIEAAFARVSIDLVDIKFEVGRIADGSILLIDELSPEVFRAWDTQTKKSLDKDVYRDQLGSVVDAYSELLQRITA